MAEFGKVTVKSTPTGADIFVDGSETGLVTTSTLTLGEGRHEISLKLEGYKDSKPRAVGISADKPITFSQKLSKLPPVPPPVPPEFAFDPSKPYDFFPDEEKVIQWFEEKQEFGFYHRGKPEISNMLVTPEQWFNIITPKPPPPPEPTTPLGQVFQAFLGHVPAWYQVWDNFIKFATERFPTLNFTQGMSPEDRKAFQDFGLREKMLFFGGPMNIQQVGESILGKQLADMTSKEIRSLAAADPNKLRNLWQGLTKSQRLGLYNALQAPGAPREAFKAVFRVVQEPIKKLVIPTWLKILTAAGTVATIWIGFQWVDFVFGLRKQKVLPPFQSEELKELGFASNAIVGLLETTKFSCDEDSFNKILLEVPPMNERWEKLITYTQENPLSKEQLEAFTDNALAYVGILPPQTGDALLATIVAARSKFNLQVEVEVAAIREKCAFGVIEPGDELYGTLILKTDPTETLVSVAGEATKHTSGEVLKILAGPHDILVEAEGFQSRRKAVFIKAGESQTASFILEKIPTEITPKAGRLQILVYDDKTGAPITATLLINGRVEKFPGHQFVLDVEPGAHEIRLEKATYDFYIDTISIEEGMITSIIARLKKIPEPELPPVEPPPEEIEPKEPEKGIVEVSANTEAQIFIGGEDIGKKTPARLELLPGTKTLTLKAEGYQNFTTKIYPSIDRPSSIAAEMTKIEEPEPETLLAELSFRSAPSSAKISINGVFTKKYTPDTILLEEGEYLVEITKSGFKTWAEPLRLVRE